MNPDQKGGDGECQKPRPVSSVAPMAAQSPADPQPVYDELRARYRLRARLPVHQRRVECARGIIAEALLVGPACVMVSGGKDSVALLHLAREVDPALPAIFVDDGAQLPWTYDVIEALREMGHAITTIETEVTLPWMLRHVGMLGYDGPEKQPGDWHWTGAQFREVLVDEPARRVRDMGWPVQLLGLRAEESHARMMNRRVRGTIYGRANGTTIACPLSDWEGADVFAYVTGHDLPLSPIYLQPDDPGRERRRTAAVLLTEAAMQGEWRRIRELLPAYWQEISREFPNMRNLT